MKLIRKPLAVIVSLAAVLATGCGPTASPYLLPSNASAYRAPAPYAQVGTFATERREIDWKIIHGRVTKLLPDDLKGSRHQHFLVAVTPKETVKVAHNIDLAPYVPVKVGDSVEIKGEYIQASPHDVIHWTHWNPRGGEGGYIRHQGKIYDKIPGSGRH